MLILGRREGESIYIHVDGMEPIRIELNRVTGWGQARIGIDAPGHIQILRGELLPNQQSVKTD